MKKAIIYLIPFIIMSCNKQTAENTFADMLIKNITLIDGTGNSELYNQNIYIKEGRILKIDTLSNYTLADTIIDGSGKYLIPGLFDNHIHLSKDPIRRLKQFIHFGITNVFVPGSSAAPYATLKQLDSLERNNLITAPKFWYTSPYVTLENAHPAKTQPETKWVDGENIYFLKDGSSIPKIISDAKANGAIGIKIDIEDGPEPPFIERIDSALIRRVADEAHANNLMLVSHVSDMEEVRLSVENGVDAIMHSPYPSFDWDKDMELIERIKKDSIYLVTTGNMRAGIDYPLHPEKLESEHWNVFDKELESINETLEKDKEIAKMTITKFFGLELDTYEQYIDYPNEGNFRKLDSMGINIVVGTDVGTPIYNVPGLGVHEELQLYQNGGMDPIRIIKCASLNAATMLGVQDNYGTIETGKYGNMVILNKNPLEDISNTLSIDVVIKNGEIQERITNANKV